MLRANKRSEWETESGREIKMEGYTWAGNETGRLRVGGKLE